MTCRISVHLNAPTSARDTDFTAKLTDVYPDGRSIIFNKGHQIRVAISSSNSPRFEPNPNTGGALPPDPKEKLVVAHQTIFLGGLDASYITLPQIVGAAAL